MKLYFSFLISISIVTFIYGQNTTLDEECKPVNILLKKNQSYNCCLENGVECQNGYIIKM